jgi:selenium-binding protein 1
MRRKEMNVRGRSKVFHSIRRGIRTTSMAVLVLSIGLSYGTAARADETCMSPYMAKITGNEDFLYVWTLGVEGMGDGSDKLVTIDVREDSKTYGKVIQTVSVGGRNEAHHAGLTDDRRYLWAGGLDTSMIFIFDIHTDPAKPRLHKTIKDFVAKSRGAVGPHTFYALPGRMLISALSNDKDHGGRTALVEYNNGGDYVVTHWLPTGPDQGAKIEKVADGYGYDVRVLPRRNVMLTSSFTGWNNYMMDFGKMLKDEEAMKRFGQTVTVWDLHARKPKKVLHVPGSPLEIRFAWGPNHNYAFTFGALTSKLWLIYEDDKGEWQGKEVADIGVPSEIPLPVDISISSDDKMLWVDSFMDGKVRAFDISDPFHPKPIYEKTIGSQLNMVSQSWDGKRFYFTSSLLANWDKKGEKNEQFLKAYEWNGKELVHKFTVDFHKENLGRSHIMRFGAYALYDSPLSSTASR